MICKGAVGNVLNCCVSALESEGARPLDRTERRSIDEKFQFWSAEGYRVLAVAIRRFEDTHSASYGVEDESQMSFAGFLLFQDLPKAGVKDALAALKHRGIGVKVITGDNRYVAIHLAGSIGLRTKAILTGEELQHMPNDALFARAPQTDLFVEIDPNQKERIISALRRAGHVVGYLGDGINDAPALHAADVGIFRGPCCRRRPRSRRHDPAGARPDGPFARGRRRAPDICQHHEIYLDHHQRQFRQHG